MLQRQCEVLVEMFNVSPLICGMAPSIWLRYVAASGLFNDGWGPSVTANCQDHLAKRAKGIILNLFILFRGKKYIIKFVFEKKKSTTLALVVLSPMKS